MFRKLSFALVLLIVAQLAQGQQLLFGRCKTPSKVEDFNVSRYQGLWYEYARYSHIFELGQKCASAQYGVVKNDAFSVQNSAISALTGAPNSVVGEAKVLGPGVLNVQFPMGGFFPQNEKANYFVAGTDYDSYAVVLSCNDFLLFHAQFVWGLTRERFPSQGTIEKINKVLDANGISRKYLHITDQNGCPSVNY